MLTIAQRAQRRKFIGSSESAAILGLDPFMSAADVWLIKTGRADDFAGNAATESGNFLEPALMAYAEHKLGTHLVRNVFMVGEHCPGLCANLDGFDEDNRANVEGKSSGRESAEWGDEELTDHVPDRVLTQSHHAMYVVGAECRITWVPLITPGAGGFRWRLFRIDRNDELAERIAAAAMDFKRKFIDADTRPDDFRPSLDVLKRVRRDPGSVVPVSDELVDAWIIAKAAKSQSEKDCELAQTALLAAMGESEGGEYSKGLVTYLETQRKGYTVDPCAYRTLRIRSAKGALKHDAA